MSYSTRKTPEKLGVEDSEQQTNIPKEFQQVFLESLAAPAKVLPGLAALVNLKEVS